MAVALSSNAQSNAIECEVDSVVALYSNKIAKIYRSPLDSLKFEVSKTDSILTIRYSLVNERTMGANGIVIIDRKSCAVVDGELGQ